MNELFWPSQTSEASGGSLVGTMSADRASGPQMPATYEQVLPVQPQEPQATPDVAGLSRVQAQGLAQDGQQATFFNKLSFNQKTGEVNVSLDQSALAEVMGQLTDLKQMKMAAMARVAQLKQQEASGSPLLDALSTFAGNMAANDPKMPGWIRALGQTSLAMGPQGIRAKREAEEQKVLGLTKATADTGLAAAKLRDDQYKVTLSMVENMRREAAQAGKEADTNARAIRREGRAQVMASGEYDRGGFIEEMRALGIPDEVIETQVNTLDKFAADRRALLAREAAADDEKERKRLEEERKRWEASQARIDARAHERSEGQYGWNVMKFSVPSNNDVKVLSNTQKALDLLDRADAYLGQIPDKYRGGPIEGWFRGKNPWRDSKDEEAFQTTYKMVLSDLQASGLSPISEVEFANAMGQMFSPKKTWAQNKKIIDNLRQDALKGTGLYLRMNKHRDWRSVEAVMPEPLKGLLPDLERMRVETYQDAAPPFMRNNTPMADLPGDFVDFLKSLPSGKGGKFTDGKTYVLRDGVPVEVR